MKLKTFVTDQNELKRLLANLKADPWQAPEKMT